MKTKWLLAFDNDNDALIPEVWAQESLMHLENNLVAGMLVHRDFEPEIAQFGDVVNTRQPAGFEAKRKVDGDDVTVQDATARNVQIRLDQHWHTTILIYDGELSKSFQDLLEFYAWPAMESIAQAVDQVVIGESYNFMGAAAGKLGVTATKAGIINTRSAMTNNKVPLAGRRFLITPDTEGDLLNIDDFVNANTVGDEGSAMREGHVGRKFGFDFFTSQNVPSIPVGNTVQTGTLNGTHAVGSTTLAVAGFGAALTRGVGAWMTVAGDLTPQRIVSHTQNTDGHTSQIVVTPGLRSAGTASGAVTVYTPGTINNSPDGYAQYYTKPLTTANFTVAPNTGQLVSLGSDLYGAVGTPTTTSVTLSRSLNNTAAHNANVAIGPAGQYNWAFHRNAVALVTRPLATPRESTGVRSSVANLNGLSCRVTISYNALKQAHMVTIDILAGVKTLDSKLGAVMFA